MNDYYKTNHERLRELVSLHHNAIAKMLQLIGKKGEAESEFWNTLKKNIEAK